MSGHVEAARAAVPVIESKPPVGVAILGCGDIVMTQHLPAFMGQKEARLVAVCDVDADRAKAAAEISGCDYYTTDHLRILSDAAVQAVFICTPPWITPQLSMEALRAGKDVLCEKPMATTVDKALEVAAVERESGQLLQVGFTYRHGPLMDALQSWIASGRLGRPLQIRLSLFDEIWDPEGDPEHYERILNTLRHGPPCIHDGAHAADHLAFLTGSLPVRVTAQGLTTRPEFPAPNYNSANIEFANGDQAKLEVGWFLPQLPVGEYQILGPNGMASLDRKNGEVSLRTGNVVERVQLTEDRVRSCFRTQLAKFVACIRDRQTPVPGSREGIASLRMTQAIADAMATRAPVQMDLQ